MEKGNKTGKGQPRWVQVDAREMLAYAPKAPVFRDDYVKYWDMRKEFLPYGKHVLKFCRNFSA